MSKERFPLPDFVVGKKPCGHIFSQLVFNVDHKSYNTAANNRGGPMD